MTVGHKAPALSARDHRRHQVSPTDEVGNGTRDSGDQDKSLEDRPIPTQEQHNSNSQVRLGDSTVGEVFTTQV